MASGSDIALVTISSIPTTIAALAAWRSARQASKKLDGNGEGSHTHMLEEVKDNLKKHIEVTDTRFEQTDHRFTMVEEQLSVIMNLLRTAVDTLTHHQQKGQ